MKQINIFVLPENLLSILESGQGKDKELYIQCLHFLSVVCSEEGKLKTKRPADNSSVTMTTLLDLPLQSGIFSKTYWSANKKMIEILLFFQKTKNVLFLTKYYFEKKITHLFQMEFPTVIDWDSPFLF